MLEIENKLEITFNVTQLISFEESRDEYIRRYVDDNIVGHCHGGCYIKEIVALQEVSPTFVKYGGIRCVGEVHLILLVKAIILTRSFVVADAKYEQKRNAAFVINNIENAIMRGTIASSDNKILQSMPSGSYLPINVSNAEYPTGSRKIELKSYGIFKYRQLQGRGAAIDTAAAKTFDAAKSIIADFKKLNDYLCSRFEDHQYMREIYQKIFNCPPELPSEAVDITDMPVETLNQMINGKYITICPPNLNAICRIFIICSDIAPAPIPNGRLSSKLPLYPIDFIWFSSILNTSAFVEISRVFKTRELIDSHRALWEFYKAR
jgi:hypothetical protein